MFCCSERLELVYSVPQTQLRVQDTTRTFVNVVPPPHVYNTEYSKLPDCRPGTLKFQFVISILLVIYCSDWSHAPIYLPYRPYTYVL